MNDNSDRKISKADVLRILDEYADVSCKGKTYLTAYYYAKAIEEIEEL